MKYRITESALRGMIREAVQGMLLTEYGDSHENSRYGAAMDAYYAALEQERYRQADTLLNYAKKAFDEDYGFEFGNGYGGGFGLGRTSNDNIPLCPYFDDEVYATSMDLTDPKDTETIRRMLTRANDLRAKQRNRMKQGLETWISYHSPDYE